jgi:cytochrome c biogenesis protein CcmG/thiol:disulfide interchange protein DsbE
MPLIIFVLVAAVLITAMVKIKSGDLRVREVPSPLIGKSVPDFVLPSLYGNEKVATQDLKCGATLLNVWASWCFACRQEHEAITWLANNGVRIIGLNYKDQPQDAKDWLQKLGNPYTRIASDLDGRVGIDWGVYGAPETFVVDEQGIIRDKHIGPISKQYIEEKLMPLIDDIRKTSSCEA